jgi:hypothetical protein
MKPQPPTLTLKRGTPVHYYVHGKPRALHLGGKLGRYRLLSNSAAHLDSGMCVQTNEFQHAVFPAPNEHGVFAHAVCARVAFTLDPRLKVAVSYVQAGPRTWCAAVSELVVGDQYRSSPVSARFSHATLDAALGAVLPPLLLELREMATATDAYLQRRHSLPKSLYGKTRRFGNNALYSIIAGIPRHIASDILKSLRRAN